MKGKTLRVMLRKACLMIQCDVCLSPEGVCWPAVWRISSRKKTLCLIQSTSLLCWWWYQSKWHFHILHILSVNSNLFELNRNLTRHVSNILLITAKRTDGFGECDELFMCDALNEGPYIKKHCLFSESQPNNGVPTHTTANY